MSQGADLGLGLAIAIAVIWFSSVPVHQDGWKGVFAFVMGLDGASLGLLVGVLVVPPLLGVAVPPLLRRPRSSFVGRDGLQTHVRRLLGGPTTSLVRFADCARMEVERVRHHVNGAYTRTSLRYEFFDATGRARFLIQTQVHEKKKSRPSDQALFAFAAEKAWNEHKARTA